MSASILILQLAVLGVVLESDLGRRKIGWFRVARPVIAVVLIVPFFFTSLPTAGGDLVLQGAGALGGLALGLAAASPLFVRVGFEPSYRGRFREARVPEGATVSRAGVGYAAIWMAVTAARLAFAYGSQHVFPAGLGRFLVSHHLSPAALTNAFIFLAIGMDLGRSLLLAGRAWRAVRPDAAGAAVSGQAAVPGPRAR